MNFFFEVILESKQILMFDFALHIVLRRVLRIFILFPRLRHEQLLRDLSSIFLIPVFLNQALCLEPLNIFQLVQELVLGAFFLLQVIRLRLRPLFRHIHEIHFPAITNLLPVLVPVRIQLSEVDSLGTHLFVLTAVRTAPESISCGKYNVLLFFVRIAIRLDVAVTEKLTPIRSLGKWLQVWLEIRMFVSELLVVFFFMLAELYLI